MEAGLLGFDALTPDHWNFTFREFHCIFKTVKKSLIVLARQNKLWEGINSMAIIESEMISHEQLILSSQGH